MAAAAAAAGTKIKLKKKKKKKREKSSKIRLKGEAFHYKKIISLHTQASCLIVFLPHIQHVCPVDVKMILLHESLMFSCF